MTRRHVALQVILAFSMGTVLGHANAADPLGFYVGGAIGQSHVRADEDAFGTPLGFDEHHNAWKVLVGLRPISLLGAEFEYIDFGHPNTRVQGPILLQLTDVRARATAIFGVLYAPIPVPLIDIFAKAGVARLQTSIESSINCIGDCPTTLVPRSFSLGQNQTRVAYGGGAQVKISAVAVRAEYERINASGGDPDLLSLGVTWSF